MTFGDRVVGALKLDANTFEDIERDPTAMGQAVGIIALAALRRPRPTSGGGFSGMLFGVCTSLIGYCSGRSSCGSSAPSSCPIRPRKPTSRRRSGSSRFAAFPGLLGVVTIIPLLGWLLMLIVYPIIWIWSMAVMVVAVSQVLDYSETFKAVIVVLIGFVVYLVFWGIVGVMFGIGAAIMGGALVA